MSFSVKKTGGRMWHEARKQEKKIRGMLVDYRRRAERRKDYYEKIKSDPTQFLQLHGRPCKIHLDPAIAAAGDSPVTMMPWQGKEDNLIDRFDVRAHLDWIPEPPDSVEVNIPLTTEDRHINYERYRIIVQNEFLGVTEEKFLHQIHIEEQFGSSKPDLLKDKKKSTNNAAIGYNYETEEGIAETVKQPDQLDEEKQDDEDSDIDLDICVEVSQIETSQAHEMNLVGQKYGLLGSDYFSFLTQDFEEAESLRQARKQEEEKAMYSGRRSRRERRAFREKKMIGRIMSPPSYAARESPDYNPYRKSSSKSRSNSPTNAGQITYITSFGGEEEIPQSSTSQNTGSSSKKINYAQLRRRKSDSPVFNDHSKVLKKSKVSRSRSRSCSRNRSYKNNSKRYRSYSRSRRNHSRSRKYSRSRSRSRCRRYRSSSRSRTRDRSRSRGRCRSRSYSTSKSKSRSRSYSRIRSRSKSRRRRRTYSSSSCSRSRSKSRRRSRTREGRRLYSRSKSPLHAKARSISRTREKSKSLSRAKSNSKTKSSSRSRSKSRIRSRSSSKSRSGSTYKSKYKYKSKSRSKSLSDRKSSSKSSSTSRSCNRRSKSQENNMPAISRYYGRRGKSSSLELELSDSEQKNTQIGSKTFSNANMNKTKAGLSTNSGGGHKQTKITPQERLKKKMQALLNRQYKADKKAEQLRIEKIEQQRQDREDELREMSLKLRRKQRERRHRYEGHSSDSRSSSSRSPSVDRRSRDSNRRDRRNRNSDNDRDRDRGRHRSRDRVDSRNRERHDSRRRYRSPPLRTRNSRSPKNHRSLVDY